VLCLSSSLNTIHWVHYIIYNWAPIWSELRSENSFAKEKYAWTRKISATWRNRRMCLFLWSLWVRPCRNMFHIVLCYGRATSPRPGPITRIRISLLADKIRLVRFGLDLLGALCL
jgi:hypothetical protein